jgi:Trypsin-like peptidase domain
MYDASPENSILNTEALQGMVNSETWFDANKFFNGIGRVKRCVCKVVTRAGSGTGFLISPNQVMTNYHVVKNVLESDALLKETKVIFDYEAQDDDTVFEGQTYSVNQTKPIELFSKYCIHDFNGEANLKLECINEELDYAIINLKDEIGNLNLEGNILTNANKAKGEETRGWIPLKIPIDNQLFEKGSVIIFQHPEGKPQKIALGLNKIMGVSPTQKRVRYNVNTMHGSSGSPVFNTNFELIALHNMGDPSFRPEFNQGVVIERIINDLVAKGYQIQL